MGIFASRPEEPFEWAGLPSEPLAPEDEVERLDSPTADLLGLAGERTASVSVPVVPAPSTTDENPPAS
jgi:hypothetical protein